MRGIQSGNVGSDRRFFFFKQKTAYEMLRSLVGSEMCIRDRLQALPPFTGIAGFRKSTGTIIGPEAVTGAKVTDLSLIHI